MLYIKYSIYTNKGRKLKFPAISFFELNVHVWIWCITLRCVRA